MDAGRYQRIKAILLEALDRPSRARATFVREACGGDAELRAEVESLLAHEKNDNFLEPPVFDRRAADTYVGKTFGHYRVLERLQAGGMGVVYVARDIVIGRRAALKFLRPELVGDEESRTRFIREATAIAALSHPNICTLYGVEETPDGDLFMAMQYYDGQTLKQMLAGGPLPVAACVDIARQIGQGLAVAHDAGIVHRDVKPGNILLADGVVKLLDFGIAKLADAAALTMHGMRIGTQAYMSPEQAWGRPVDHRSDIWSLGVVVYEMLSGRPPYAETPRGIANDIAPRPPSIAASRNDVPPALEAVVVHSLSIEPGGRYQSIRELVAALDAVGAQAGPRARIAVAPFRQSARIGEPQLADALTEAAIDGLSIAGGLVVCRGATGGTELTGTVAVRSGQVRIVARVHETPSGHVAAEWTLEGLRTALPELVADLVRRVTTHLDVRLTADEARQLEVRARAEPTAYWAHQLGRCCLREEKESGARAAISHFESAVLAGSDAMAAVTHAAIAETSVALLELRCDDADEWGRRARAELEAAARIDNAAPEVVAASAAVALRLDGSPAVAESALRHVLTVRPSDARASVRLAECLAISAKPVEAGAVAKDAAQSGCCSPGQLLRAARVLYFAQQYHDALDVLDLVVQRMPDDPIARLDLAATCAKRRDVARAVAECDRALDAHVGRALLAAAAGNAARARGDRARYDLCWRALRRFHQEEPVPACAFDLIETSFGNTGRPIEYLEGYDDNLGVARFLGYAMVAGSLTRYVSSVGLIAYLGLDPSLEPLAQASSLRRWLAPS